MYKQLTKEDRLRIYEGLNRNESLSGIGRAIGKDRSTIAREIKRNREAKAGSYTGQTRRCTRKKEECPVHGACGGICIKTSCWRCEKVCNELSDDEIEARRRKSLEKDAAPTMLSADEAISKLYKLANKEIPPDNADSLMNHVSFLFFWVMRRSSCSAAT